MNLFLLSGPYQLLSAVECVHHFGLSGNRLVIVDTGHFTREAFDAVVDPAAWDGVEWLDVRYIFPDFDFGALERPTLRDRAKERALLWHQIRLRRRVEAFIERTPPCDSLVLGNYLADYDLHMRHLARHLRHERLILVDVGTDTLRIARHRNEENRARREGPGDGNPPGGGLTTRTKQALRRRWVDFDRTGVERLTFFSAYDLEVSGQDTLVRNTYTHTRSKLATSRSSDTVYFVGQPLVDQGYLHEDVYADILGQVKRHFAGRRVVYVRHPRESAHQLEMVQRHGFEIGRGRAPFEHEVCFGEDQPGCVAAFFSSVVENCAAIFGRSLPIVAFEFPLHHLQKDHENVGKIYEEFRSNPSGAIEVVELTTAADSR